jgi:hypothetical protein
MRWKPGVVVGVAALIATSAPVVAHHAIQAQFDFDKPLHLTGTLTKIEWINPHAYMFLDVKERDGKVRNWALEMVGPAGMKKAGLSRTDHRTGFKVGDTISVNGFMAKDGTYLGFVKELKLSDGRTVAIWFGDPYAR